MRGVFVPPDQHEARVLVVPRRSDILCGSGNGSFKHPGNLLFRSIVESKAEDYATASTRILKSKITKDILVQIHSTGARVLREDLIHPSWYHAVENPDKVLRDKTTHYLRAFLNKIRWSAAGAALPPPQPDNQEDKHQEDSKTGMLSVRRQCLSPPRRPSIDTRLVADSSISVRTIQEMQKSPLLLPEFQSSDLLWIMSLFNKKLELPSIYEYGEVADCLKQSVACSCATSQRIDREDRVYCCPVHS